MSDNVNFKVYLTCEDDPTRTDPQVRRFTLRKESATFPKLQEKLATLFPGVQWWLSTISWKDAEGDDVIVSSTEELRLALEHMRDEDTCKLDIFIKSSDPAGDSDCHRTESAPIYSAKNELPTLHVDTTCDGCDNDEIRGFLYKCLQCEDFDLCADCEAKGVHPEHCMIRSAIPIVHSPTEHNVPNVALSENVASTRITLHHYDRYNAISFE